MQKAVTKRPSGGSYGIGWGISSHRGVPTVSHTGSMGGVTTSLLLIPSIKAAVVVLSNTRTALVASFSREIADILLEEYDDVAERILFPVPSDPRNDEAARRVIEKLQSS